MNRQSFCTHAFLPLLIFILFMWAEAAHAASPDGSDASNTGTANARFGGAVLINGAADGAHAVAVADLDRDGHQDVVSAAREDGKIIWYRNNGVNPPAFDAREIDVLPGAYALFAGDINGDGAVDIAAVAVGEVQPSGVLEGGDSLVWYENDRGAVPGFARRDLFTSLDYPVAVDGVDLDRDGDLDLLSASRDDGKIIWYENSGGGAPSFTPHLISDAYSGTVAVHTGDLDGDGDPDVVAAAENVDVIVWFEHDGAPQPGFAPNVIRTAGAGYDPERDYAKTVYVADLDGDGDNDIAYGSEEVNEVGWYVNDGGADPAFALRVISNEVNHIKSVRAADLDRDGDADLVTASTGDNRIVIFDNDGASDPTFAGRELVAGLLGARATAVADLTGDGRMDLVTASRVDDRILWFPNQAIHFSALFHAPGRHVIDIRERMRHATSGDMDGDGDLDVLTISDKEVVWHVNDGAMPPSFSARQISTNLDAGRWVDLGDLDGDGDPDAIAASTNSNTLYWYENQAGVFVEHVIDDQVRGIRAALAGDVDGDGDLDIYTASHDDDRIMWFENTGGRPLSFIGRVVTENADYARSVYGADVDGDGDLDLMSASQNDHMVRWYQNDGVRPPGFRPFDLTSAEGVQHVHAADVDGDGDLDILFAAEYASTIGWMENLGGATPGFIRHDVDTAVAAVHAVTAGDLDRDGDTDLVAAVEGLNAIMWYENVGVNPTRFVRHTAFDRAQAAHGVHVDDIDRDGDIDLLIASREDGTAAWFENLGGQYAVGVDAVSTASLVPGEWQRLATVVAVHRGRAGDADVELNRLDLIFAGATGRLDTVTLNSRVALLGIFRDGDGNGRFDPAVDLPLLEADQLILAEDGRLTLTIPPASSAAATVVNGRPATFFVGAILTGTCADSAAPFSVSLQLTAETALDDRHGTPLLADGMRTLAATASTEDGEDERLLLINEFMADNNTTLEDPEEASEYPDWVEIYNAGPVAADLSGMYLTDDLTRPTQYRIPDGVIVPAFGYLLFIADGDHAQGPLHTNFRLDRNGESIGLFDRDVNGNRVLDVVTFDEQAPDVAYGRLPNGGPNLSALPLATPGRLNTTDLLDVEVYLPFIGAGRVCR